MSISRNDPEADVSPEHLVDESLAALVAAHLPDAVIVLDGAASLRWGNAAAERLFGRTLSEAVGVSALEFIHPDDIELVLRSLASVREKEVGTLIEIRVATPSGWTLVEVVGKIAPEVGANNLLFVLRDITDRRRFEVARDDVAKFRSIVQYAPFVTMLITPDRLIEAASAAMTRAFGHDPEQIEGRPIYELFAPEDRPAIELALERAPMHGPVTIELVCIQHDGEIAPVEVIVASLLDDPTIAGFVVSLRSIAELSDTQRDLREALSLLEATLESTADGILVIDRNGSIVSYNRRFVELWGLPEEILNSGSHQARLEYGLAQLVDADQIHSKLVAMSSDPATESFDTFELHSGKVIERYTRPQRVGSEIVGRVSSFRDVTERRRLEEALAHRAYHDSLTGLANKELFLDRLETAAQRGDVAVLFIDLDGLKAVNDRFGHLTGDQLLKNVAEVLRIRAGSNRTVGRLGGDEFGVIVEGNFERSDVEATANAIIAGLPESFSVGGANVETSVSIGIAIGAAGAAPLDVLQHADAAMYVAKRQGGGRWELVTTNGSR